ncbi:uncharacterized protein LOC135093689 [Scylla paramamosain]|uniref:uncharacterized protein LOC135093689 n=1 Tax=Scylla paramamosain TaxID=85552 RepID=UPI00308358E3
MPTRIPERAFNPMRTNDADGLYGICRQMCDPIVSCSQSAVAVGCKPSSLPPLLLHNTHWSATLTDTQPYHHFSSSPGGKRGDREEPLITLNHARLTKDMEQDFTWVLVVRRWEECALEAPWQLSATDTRQAVGDEGIDPRYEELARVIKAQVPQAEVTGFVGRSSSFEVTVNDSLIFSKLERKGFPDFDEIVDAVIAVEDGGNS